jgi:Tol biopolymer transport system component
VRPQRSAGNHIEKTRGSIMKRVFGTLGLTLLLAGSTLAQITQRASTATSGTQGNGESNHPNISADGRIVVFASFASTLVPGDTNASTDVFVRDRATGETTRVSVDSAGVQGDSGSYYPAVSADGRFVAFQSDATNLVPGDTNGHMDVFVRDRLLGTTELVSLSTAGVHGGDLSGHASISGDGRWVTYYSYSSNLVPGDTNANADVFLRDRLNGVTSRISVSSNGVQGDGFSTEPTISPDGRFIVFASNSTTLTPGEADFVEDIFIRDRLVGTTTKVSVPWTGTVGGGNSSLPCLSANGQYVAFESESPVLVPDDTNGYYDIFVRDLEAGVTTRVSVGPFGQQADGDLHWPAISQDGRFISFFGWASNLVAGDINGVWDTFLYDRQSGTNSLVSVDSSGAQGDANSAGGSFSADARFLAFSSWAGNLVAGDTNGKSDIFIRDLDLTGFDTICDPGVAGVIACPCSNPPGATGHGCDNSSATGGARLSAAGSAYLSVDRLVFTADGATPTSTGILLQGDAELPLGAVFGQGVRCAGGTLKRLYVKSIAAGSMSAPEFDAGDMSVSARSQALGDPIAPGARRTYLVYYRDPVVLGGCSAASTFNATQTGIITWWP